MPPSSLVRLDTNLLVLLIAGLTSPAIISKHKRLKKYNEDDFYLLLFMLDGAHVCVLPNVATEAHNLLKQHDNPERDIILAELQIFICKNTIENYVPNKIAVNAADYMKLGVTDTAILITRSPRLITDDLDLYLAAIRDGQDAINFTHLRVKEGLIDQP